MSTDIPLPGPDASTQPVTSNQPERRIAAQLGQFLFNHNPFYLISAFLTLYGIHAVFGVETVGELKTASVLMAIGGYTAILGMTGVLIVRYGKVWEDARTVLLAVILMLLATSVCTDELLMLAPSAALRLIVGGLIFAVMLCELIIRGLRIRFGLEFRIPLFLQLAILFLYPYFCASEVRDLTPEQAQWRVLGFPIVFSLGLTTLWPAVIRGSKSLRDNGTPWNWPLYPWCLFIVIAAAGAFRCRILTESFDPTPGMAVTFGSFYLLPILMTVAWLLIETGIVEQRPSLIRGTMWVSLFLLLLALPGHGSSLQRDFYETVAQKIGSPLFWCVVGLASLYGCARLRGVKNASGFFLAMIALLSFVGPQTSGIPSIRFIPWPLVAVGLTLVIAGWQSASARKVAWGLTLCSTAIPTMCREFSFASATPTVLVHYAWICSVMLGLRFRDKLGRRFEIIGCCSLPLLVAVAMLKPEWLHLTLIGGRIESAVLTFIAFGIGWGLRRPGYLWAGLVIVGAGLGEVMLNIYRNAAGAIGRRGLWALSWSLASFVTAVLISLMKGGQLSEIRQIRKLLNWIRQTPENH